MKELRKEDFSKCFLFVCLQVFDSGGGNIFLTWEEGLFYSDELILFALRIVLLIILWPQRPCSTCAFFVWSCEENTKCYGKGGDEIVKKTLQSMNEYIL